MNAAATVFGAALLTALATGLGALPFVFVRTLTPAVAAAANALAAGLMLGASFGLVAEGTRHGTIGALGGVAAGVACMLVMDRLLRRHDVQFGRARGAGGRRMLLMVAVMTAHSFSEGVAVGVAFGGGTTLAVAITIAIAVHNVPEGLAISAVLRPQGVSLPGCVVWSIVSSLPQPVTAVPAFLFVETFRPLLPWGLGFAAGAMVFMVLVELLPEAYEKASDRMVALLVSLSFLGMVWFQRHL